MSEPTLDQLELLIAAHHLDTLSTLDTAVLLWHARRRALEEALAIAEPPPVSPETPWEKGYWAAENTIAHDIRALINTVRKRGADE